MYVVVSRENQRLFAVRLGAGASTVGRGLHCDVILPSPEVSRLHAVVTPATEGVHLEDHSRNGILIGGESLPSGIVAWEQAIQVGPYALRFIQNGTSEPETWEQVIEHHAVSPRDNGFCGMLGSSAPMQALFEKIRKAAFGRASVLIVGETGTGKELIARALHSLGSDRRGPWIAVNCAAISVDLVESELFGHEKGAFTGATSSRIGAFEAADGGTLFLDEVGEMPLSVQPKLLRALESREVTRVGGQKPVQVAVRVISATNRNLARDVEAGRFRSDLYHRLCVLPFYVPPLRERASDVAELARAFLNDSGEPYLLDDPALDCLCSHSWPGNVRELRNVVQRLVTAVPGGRIDESAITAAITAGQAEGLASSARAAPATGRHPGREGPALPADVDGPAAVPDAAEFAGRSPEPPMRSGGSLRDVERLALIRALDAANGNRRAAARELCISPSTLYEKIRRYGIGSAGRA